MRGDDQGFMGFPSRADFQAMLEVVDRKRAQRLKDEESAREARRLDLENQVIEAATRIYEAEKANSRATVIADALDELAGKLRAGWRLVPPDAAPESSPYNDPNVEWYVSTGDGERRVRFGEDLDD